MAKRTPRLDLNPSSADRWTTCTASPRFILDNWDKVPESSDTVYNREGTLAHAVAAAYLLNQPEPPSLEYVEQTPLAVYQIDPKSRVPENQKKALEVNVEMRRHGFFYSDYVESLRQPGSTLLVEQKLPLWYMPGRNAIVDAAVVNPDGLHIIDYKYGEGVPVSFCRGDTVGIARADSHLPATGESGRDRTRACVGIDLRRDHGNIF